MKYKNIIKKIILSTLLVLVSIGIFGIFSVVLAQDRFGLESATGVGLPQADLRIAIINIIRFILGFLGLVAVIIIMWAGYLWLTAGGEVAKIDKAKKTLISAVIGLVIILSAFVIASFVIRSISGALCSDGNCPTASCPTPPCSPVCATPPCTPGLSSQYSYINKFKDNSLSWSRSVGAGFSGVVSIPPSASLEVGAYAKNKGGTVVGLELFTAPMANAFTAQSAFVNVPNNLEIVDNVFAPWDSSGYSLGASYKSKISALFSGNKTVESNEVKTVVKPTHCFNNIQDQGETGVDCGGDSTALGDNYCGACDGGACSQDSECASGICLANNTCAFAPVITSLDPDNGAKGNYITIWGRHFGANPGAVRLIKNESTAAFADININPDCVNGWTDTQIIFAVPDVSLENYQVAVDSQIGLTSNTKEFEVNSTERPGICSINPDFGVSPDSIDIIGNNFPTAPEGKVYWNFQPDIFSSPGVAWVNATKAIDVVPERGVGATSVRIYNGAEYSNYYKFLISGGELGDPCGEVGATTCSASNVCQSGLSCDPNQNCTCQVVANACEPGFARSCDQFSPCVGKEVCPESGNWDEAVCAKVDATCNPDITVTPATQSIFTWAFSYSNGYGFQPPQVVEDCSRVSSCSPNQKLPSPAPWYEGSGASEGWDRAIHQQLSIANPKACVNATISARFTQKMNEQSVKDHIKVYKCATKEGANCEQVSGQIEVYSTENDASHYFKFGSPTLENSNAFSAKSWYKVVLTKGIKSIFNVEMTVSSQAVEKRFCNIAGITDAVYCWNFQTRDSADYCDPGCPECNPDPKTMNYYLESEEFNTDVISSDNICLMIDPWDYNWAWSSEDENKVKITNSGGDPKQTGTAYGENYNLSPNFTKIFSELTQTSLNDYCRVTTDFTNPVVIENSYCSRGTIQSPTPWINSQDACRNALIAARFSRDMNDTSLTLNTKIGLTENSANSNNGNIIVEKCDNKDKFEDAFSSCASIKLAEAGSLRIFTYSHDVNLQELLAGENNFGQGIAEGFVIDVNKRDLGGNSSAAVDYLASNTWYRVIILGGPNGVGGADKNDDGTPDGLLLTENSIIPVVRKGWDYNGDGFDDYYWIFKTGASHCNVSDVQVTPAENFLAFKDQTSEYDAFPQASNCNILARCLLNWTWRSLIALGDTSETGDSIATITKLKVQSGVCGNIEDDIFDPVQTATAKSDGETNIRADEPGGQWSSGHLQVGYGDLAVVKYSPQNTTHFSDKEISFAFNIDAKFNSVRLNNTTNHTVNLYKCSDNQCAVSGLSAKNLSLVGSYGEFNKEIKVESNDNYDIGSYYRVVLKGGPNGLKAWNDNQLTGLNFNSIGKIGGEECEPSIYPWKEQPGVCSNNCLLSVATASLSGDEVIYTPVDLCSLAGGRFAECAEGSDYCDTACHNKGNNNLASCGNGLVETAEEECDDKNTNNNDGCSAHCLLEGSSDRWGSLCGNNRIEKGEACDDGNKSSGDGCSSLCLRESGRPSGSNANMPVCGNGLKERGEDCDDNNKSNNDGCSSICLSEGSTAGGATCGNGIVQAGQADSFSWTFKAIDDPAVSIDMNNCSNGIWQVSVKRGNIQADDIFVCHKGDVAMSDDNIWGKIIGKVKLALVKLLGGSVSAGESDGCGAGYTPVTDFTEKLEHLNGDSHIYTYIKNGPFTINDKYKIVVYDGTKVKLSKEVTIKEYCLLSDIKVEIWPRGEEKNQDNFFCIGDECGLKTTSLYDNDISSSANADAPSSAYDFPYLKSLDENINDPNKENNQHLYLAWAVNPLGYLIKAENGFTWTLVKAPKFDLSNESVDETAYEGDQWISLNGYKVAGSIDGQDQLIVTAKQAVIEKSKQVDIKIFLCNNPWPAPENFPYLDDATPAPDTNFAVYYCRDNGATGEADDLPALDTDTVVVTLDQAGTPVNEFKKEFLFKRADKSDAVGIRVLPNENHYSPLVWYRENFDRSRQGKPQSLSVDSYDAIQEGRTVYINAVNIEPELALYPNIYLISYSEGADSQTQNIYGQMAKYMKFNVGRTDAIGALPLFGVCQGDATYKCWNNSDCEAVKAGACLSDKGKLTRDTRRLGDIQDINWLLADYHKQKRCSNDKALTCSDSTACYGGGVCGNYYPDLPSGTYISGRSFSVWPSWQATLGNVLGSALPIDHLNASSGFDGCASPYDPTTCWNDISKTMQCPTAAKVYAYFSTNQGAVKNIYAFNEYTAGSWRPSDWASVNLMGHNPFSLAVDSICRTFSATCGNGIPQSGEDCNNCPFDKSCDPGYSCRSAGTPAVWSCTADAVSIDSDGDDKINKEDNCPFVVNANQADIGDGDKVGDVCDNCPSIKNGSNASTATCLDKDNNGVLSAAEKAVCNQSDKDGDTIGDACDNCPNDYNKDQTNTPCVLPRCGDGIIDNGEVCDDLETPPTNLGRCNATCSAPTRCGDGVIQSTNGLGQTETCDDKNTTSGDGCSSICTIENSYTCVGTPSICQVSTCGDGIRQGAEVCDCGIKPASALNGLLPAPSDCGQDGATYTTYNIPSSANLNNYFIPYYHNIPITARYCTASCQPAGVNLPYCGDGEFDLVNENCEGRRPNGDLTASDGTFGWGLGTEESQWSCDATCHDTGGYCGNGVKDGLEECEPSLNVGLCSNTCTWKACPPYINSTITLGTFSNKSAPLNNVPVCLNPAGQITADFSLSVINPATIVFVSDLSSGMGGAKLNNLQNGLKDAIGQIFADVPKARIGLVSFKAIGINDIGDKCPDSLCDNSQIEILNSIIDAYSAGGATNIDDGLIRAKEIMTSPIIPALNKYVILMSDGKYESGSSCNQADQNNWSMCYKYSSDSFWDLCFTGPKYSWSCDGLLSSGRIKNMADPTPQIYSVAYGLIANRDNLNNISSSNGAGSCDGSGYCYNSSQDNDLGGLYSSIISDITNNMSINFQIMVGSKTTSFAFDLPLSDNLNKSGQTINLPDNFCNIVNKTLSYTGAGFTLAISNLNLSYCPAHPLAYETSGGIVAGISDEEKTPSDNIWLSIFNNLKKLIFNFLK